MPILRSLPAWADPEQSMGRQIPSLRIRRRQVWWARGPALETFEKDIQPEIEHHLSALDFGYSDLFVRLYMIGRNPETANPIIMLCSTDKRAREAAEATIRQDGLLEGHKGFGLGTAALPLEHPAPVRRLSPHTTRPPHPVPNPPPLSEDIQRSPPSKRSIPPGILQTLLISDKSNDSFNGHGQTVFAFSLMPKLGRRIFIQTGSSRRQATAGVVLKVGGNYYQLTVGHSFEAESDRSEVQSSMMNLDECCFDGQSDDEESGPDYESEITQRGSESSEDVQSRDDSPSDFKSQGTTHSFDVEVHHDPADHARDTVPGFVIGSLLEGMSFQSLIDYAMIAIPSYIIESMGSGVNAVHIPCRDVAAVGREERSIIVVRDVAVIRGTLLPGKVSYKSHRTGRFEALLQVSLEGELLEGDCGSPVLDESTGSLYGHIAMGVPGTKVGYVVQAVDIFPDIETRAGENTFSLSIVCDIHLLRHPCSQIGALEVRPTLVLPQAPQT
ncbi:hypothetical protein F5Y07DRAFT_393063 [Xylaria sp. FL0933]|nr:hypothetical protein F5Y07DRAFT_393063 [Xylaria sp. FL0933]